ncbi:RsiV family protein [Sulfurimonas sp.]|uniref:RsiV family protein n=1 Tax=Sulfurimonas sp. TaxID=2022749 RepID=UPI002AB005AB|nr:RsiV family protein [Sulfurimonas sp.]
MKSNVLDEMNENLVQYNSELEEGIISPYLVSLKMNQYTFHMPSLNGNNSSFAININPITNEDYDFFDIFDAKRNALEEIKVIIKRRSDCDFFERFDKASFIPRFFIKNDGIEFIFSEYEVSSGMCGNIVVFMYYHELVEFLKPNGPLGFFVTPSRTWNADFHWYKAVFGTLELEKGLNN